MSSIDDKVQTLNGMGFPLLLCEKAMAACNGNITRASEWCLQHMDSYQEDDLVAAIEASAEEVDDNTDSEDTFTSADSGDEMAMEIRSVPTTATWENTNLPDPPVELTPTTTVSTTTPPTPTTTTTTVVGGGEDEGSFMFGADTDDSIEIQEGMLTMSPIAATEPGGFDVEGNIITGDELRAEVKVRLENGNTVQGHFPVSATLSNIRDHVCLMTGRTPIFGFSQPYSGTTFTMGELNDVTVEQAGLYPSAVLHILEPRSHHTPRHAPHVRHQHRARIDSGGEGAGGSNDFPNFDDETNHGASSDGVLRLSTRDNGGGGVDGSGEGATDVSYILSSEQSSGLEIVSSPGAATPSSTRSDGMDDATRALLSQLLQADAAELDREADRDRDRDDYRGNSDDVHRAMLAALEGERAMSQERFDELRARFDARASGYGGGGPYSSTSGMPAPYAAVVEPGMTRLKIRMLDGTLLMQDFHEDTTLGEVCLFIDANRNSTEEYDLCLVNPLTIFEADTLEVLSLRNADMVPRASLALKRRSTTIDEFYNLMYHYAASPGGYSGGSGYDGAYGGGYDDMYGDEYEDEYSGEGPDVDRMTYDQLLALEAEIGDVSTGLTEDEVAMLAVTTYDVATDQQEDCDRCTVCLCDFEAGDQIRTLPCSHIYHYDCIENWLKGKPTCPICTKDVRAALNGE